MEFATTLNPTILELFPATAAAGVTAEAARYNNPPDIAPEPAVTQPQHEANSVRHESAQLGPGARGTMALGVGSATLLLLAGCPQDGSSGDLMPDKINILSNTNYRTGPDTSAFACFTSTQEAYAVPIQKTQGDWYAISNAATGKGLPGVTSACHTNTNLIYVWVSKSRTEPAK